MTILAPEAEGVAEKAIAKKAAKKAAARAAPAANGAHRKPTHKPRHASGETSEAPTSSRADSGEKGGGKKPAATSSPAPKTLHDLPIFNGDPEHSVSTYRNILTAEIIVGSIIILKGQKSQSLSKALLQEFYFLCVFFVLAILTTGGQQTARFAALLGALIVVGLLINHIKNGPKTSAAVIQGSATGANSIGPEQLGTGAEQAISAANANSVDITTTLPISQRGVTSGAYTTYENQELG